MVRRATIAALTLAAVGSLVAALAGAGVAGANPKPTPSPSPPPAAATYTITDLGSLGYGVTRALAINNNGQVTGYSYTGATVPEPGTCCANCYTNHKTPCVAHLYHAFLWANGVMTDLGTLGGNYSQGLSINLSGQVVGSADTKAGPSDSVLWTGTKMTDLTTTALAGLSSATVAGINDSGQIVGSFGNNPQSHPFLYSNGTNTDLPEPSYATASGAMGCGVFAIDNNGQILGACDDATSTWHTVLWQNGTVTDLSTLSGVQGFGATAISHFGLIAGSAQTSTGAYHEFLYRNGTVTDLGASLPITAAVNDSGVIIGGDLIYSGGTLQNLNNLIPAGSVYTIQYATGINDKGQIIADAYNSIYQTHALLLTPS